MLARSDETLAQQVDPFPWERTLHSLHRLIAASRSISDRGRFTE
jgi:hypothetical protein